LATSATIQCRTPPDVRRSKTTRPVDHESRMFSLFACLRGRVTSSRTIDTRCATRSRISHGSRPFTAPRRSRVSLKSVCRKSAESLRSTQSMQSTNMVRDSIACVWRAHRGDNLPPSGRAWLARQTRALFRITLRVGRVGLTEQCHWQHRLRRHVRRVLTPSETQLRPALTANRALFLCWRNRDLVRNHLVQQLIRCNASSLSASKPRHFRFGAVPHDIRSGPSNSISRFG
jgi:hypothetical protein